MLFEVLYPKEMIADFRDPFVVTFRSDGNSYSKSFSSCICLQNILLWNTVFIMGRDKKPYYTSKRCLSWLCKAWVNICTIEDVVGIDFLDSLETLEKFFWTFIFLVRLQCHLRYCREMIAGFRDPFVVNFRSDGNSYS